MEPEPVWVFHHEGGVWMDFSIPAAGGGTTDIRLQIGPKHFPTLRRMMADAIEHDRAG